MRAEEERVPGARPVEKSTDLIHTEIVDARTQIRAPEPWNVSPVRASMLSMTHHSSPILVLGGTGKTGRRIVHRLRAAAVPVRVGSRTAPLPFE